ncbi:Rab3 GTPase-activating protein catalytic subunit-domain-containing protein [Gorgonomyces haynaldii]|nr:Rab3 GTPase-activating protein catalytic subunit-domain-containing protein [Gorgonomyces haynaldii]
MEFEFLDFTNRNSLEQQLLIKPVSDHDRPEAKDRNKLFPTDFPLLYNTIETKNSLLVQSLIRMSHTNSLCQMNGVLDDYLCKSLCLKGIPPKYNNLQQLIHVYEERFESRDVEASILISYETRDFVIKTGYKRQKTVHFVGGDADPVLAPLWELVLKPVTQKLHLKRLLKDCFSLDHFQDKRGYETLLPGAFNTAKTVEQMIKAQSIGTAFLPNRETTEDRLHRMLMKSISVKPMLCSRRQETFKTQEILSLMRSRGITVPYQSLLWQFCSVLLKEYDSFDMIPLLKTLWPKLIHHIHGLYESKQFIPGIEIRPFDHDKQQFLDKPVLDLNHTLVHQKLSMIQCCLHLQTHLLPTPDINTTITEHSVPVFSTQSGIAELQRALGEDLRPSSLESDQSWLKQTDMMEQSVVFVQKESLNDLDEFVKLDQELGQLKAIGVLENGKQMWEPHTQPEGYMTQDMIQEQAQVFENLGTSAHGQELRQRMQSRHLLSDMSSFKAANPGCTLVDFVKWHSPRDYIGPGVLSPRMMEPGNLWNRLWESADPIPASQQKPIFDPESNALRALDYLEHLDSISLLNMYSHSSLVDAYLLSHSVRSTGTI